MKKIITLLFFVGFLTSAFAQPGRHEQYGNQKNYKNQPGKNDQWNDRDHGNNYSYNKGRDHWDRGYRDRDGGRRDHNYYHGYRNYGRMENYRYHRSHSWFRMNFNSRRH